jgi:glycosyltransferase involved in cell wall biosynthesis
MPEPSVVSIIIPCFNEAQTIARVLDRVCALTMPLGARKEIMIVDDGSGDGSADVLHVYAKTHPDVRVFLSPVNLGKGAAVRIGVALSSGDVIIIQDADLELTPEQIPDLVEPILDGKTDVVFGSRFLGGRRFRPWRTYLANRFLTCLTQLLYTARLTDMETCYKAFRRRVIEMMDLRSIGFEIEPELTAKIIRFGHRIHERAVSYSPRNEQQGKKIRARDGLKAIYYLVKYRFQAMDQMRAKRRTAAPSGWPRAGYAEDDPPVATGETRR